jgi:hypothetical protein
VFESELMEAHDSQPKVKIRKSDSMIHLQTEVTWYLDESDVTISICYVERIIPAMISTRS